MNEFTTAIYPIIIISFGFIAFIFSRSLLRISVGSLEWQDLSLYLGVIIGASGLAIDQAFWFFSRLYIDEYAILRDPSNVVGLTKAMIASGGLFVGCSRLGLSGGMACVIWLHVAAAACWGICWALLLCVGLP